MLTIDPRYFKTIGLPLQRGRDLTDEDGMTGREARGHQSALRGAALPERGSDRPPHHAVDRSAGRRAAAGRHPAVADGHHRRHRAEPAPARFPAARSGSDRLPAVQDRSARLHEPDRAQRRRSERDDADPARGGARHRSGPAAVRHPDDGRRSWRRRDGRSASSARCSRSSR